MHCRCLGKRLERLLHVYDISVAQHCPQRQNPNICCQGAKKKVAEVNEATYYNGLLKFFDGISLIVLVNAILNIKSAEEGLVNYNANFFIACLLVLLVFLHFIWVIKIFVNLKRKREKESFQKKYSSIYENLNEKGFRVLYFHFVTLFRDLSIAASLNLLSDYDFF